MGGEDLHWQSGLDAIVVVSMHVLWTLMEVQSPTRAGQMNATPVSFILRTPNLILRPCKLISMALGVNASPLQDTATAGKVWRAQKATEFAQRAHLLLGATSGSSGAGYDHGDKGGQVLRELLEQLQATSAAVDDLADEQAKNTSATPWWADGEYNGEEAERCPPSAERILPGAFLQHQGTQGTYSSKLKCSAVPPCGRTLCQEEGSVAAIYWGCH